MYRRILFAVLAAVWIGGCSSEQQRYKENRAGAHLSPRAKAQLSTKDLEQICALIAHSTRKRIICISTSSVRVHPNAFCVIVGYSWDIRSDFQSQFGLYYVRRDKQTWHILEGGDGLSESLVGLACEDPPP